MENVAVFILLGQSNAVGHGIPMDEVDKIKTPMKNVYGLSRELNQSYDNDKLYWTGYTSCSMNLAEEQDDTYSIANLLAKHWQKEIDNGNALPDLYIVHIAIGAQGVTGEYMWNPEREKKLIPGRLGTVDISLHSFTVKILSLLDNSFKMIDKNPDYIGLHWRGGENDSTADICELKASLKNIYKTMFSGYCKAIGSDIPIILHRIVCVDRANDLDPTGEKLKRMFYIDDVFDELKNENENISVFDITNCPYYIPDVRCNGIFIDDAVHYTPQVNEWVALEILKEYKGNII